MQILETHMRQKLLLISWRENPVRKEYKTIETLTNSTTKKSEKNIKLSKH